MYSIPVPVRRTYLPHPPDACQQAKSDQFIEAGDIGAAVGFKDIRTGDTLCVESHPISGEHGVPGTIDRYRY